MRDLDERGDALRDRKTGDPRALLEAAYTAHADRLYRYALMLLTDHAAAEDAVHQAFVKLARMGWRAMAIESCAYYLRTAVRNECWRMLGGKRRRGREVELVSAEPILEAAHESGVDADERLKIEAALRELPPEQREVIHMKVYEGNTFQQVADLLGVSINTVASRYRYAMDKLHHLLNCPGNPEGYSHERR